MVLELDACCSAVCTWVRLLRAGASICMRCWAKRLHVSQPARVRVLLRRLAPSWRGESVAQVHAWHYHRRSSMRLAAGDVVCVQWQRITWVVQLHAGLGQQQGMPSPLCSPKVQHMPPGSPECRCSLGTALALVGRPDSSIISGDCTPAYSARSAAYAHRIVEAQLAAGVQVHVR